MNKRALAAWMRLFTPAGVSEQRCIESYQHIIHPAYTESHRRYHTDLHLDQCIKVINERIPYVPDLDAILLAIFFHDLVYDPRKSNNEEESAGRFAALCRRSLPIRVDLGMKVSKAILATKHNGKPTDDVSRYVVDVDLSIFGVGDESYYDRNYAWPVREEYAFVPDRIYKKKRAEILQSFLDRQNIYHTQVFQNAFEDKARTALKREIKFLRRR
jgi:predicted metal-dependent HD superfamily phosphohydrolase